MIEQPKSVPPALAGGPRTRVEDPDLCLEAIVAAARTLLGLPFRNQGRDPETGLDCRGLLLCIGYKASYQFTREYANNYRANPDPKSEAFALKAAELRLALETEFELLPGLQAPAPSLIVLIRFPQHPLPVHCGIVADGPLEPMLIHVLARESGAVTEEPLRRWEKYVVDVFAWRADRFQLAN